MDYKEEDEEDKKYKGKKFTRKDFKKDVKEAVQEAGKPAFLKKKLKNGGAYAGWSAAKLRTFLNEKKKALLIKSGFPGGTVPRAKAAMILLCKKLKRKRW